MAVNRHPTAPAPITFTVAELARIAEACALTYAADPGSVHSIAEKINDSLEILGELPDELDPLFDNLDYLLASTPH